MKDKFLLSKNHKTILDLGAGAGDFAMYLAESLGSQIACVDFSPAMKEIALKKYPKLNYLTASAEKLPFKNNTFDAVIGIGILHHLKIQGILDENLKEISRVLKSNGNFCYLDRADSSLAKVYEAFLSSIKRLFLKIKKGYSASSTSSEISLTATDLAKIRKKFKPVSRFPIYSMPFKFLLVISNVVFYVLGRNFYLRFQRIFFPLASFFEKYLNFHFWQTEYCEVLKNK